MEENKISVSLTTVIVIAVIIGTVILGLFFYLLNNNSKKNVDYDKQTVVDTSTNTEIDNSSNSNSNNSNTTTSINEDSSSLTSNKITAKTSSKQNPLSVGEWGICSKYNKSEYKEVSVKVTNIIRGTNAAKKVKEYCDRATTIYKYEDAKDGMEWAVVEYSIDLTNIEGYNNEKSINVDSQITGTGDNKSIKYNGKTYIVSTMSLTNENSKENIATGYFAVQLPKGCTDYLIVLGSSSHTQAFFAGE